MNISSHAMLAEIYKGSLRSSGIEDIEIENTSEATNMICKVPLGAFGNSNTESMEVALTFKAGCPVEFDCRITKPVVAASFDLACKYANNLNAGGSSVMCCLENDGIYARALGFVIVPEQADPMLAVSENTRLLSAEADVLIEEIMTLSNPRLFSDLEFSDTPTFAEEVKTVSYDDISGMFDVIADKQDEAKADPESEGQSDISETGDEIIVKDDFDDIYEFVIEDDDDDERRFILDSICDVAATCVVISKAQNVSMPNEHRKKLSNASNYLIRAIMPLAKSYDEGKNPPVSWQITPSQSDEFFVWGRKSGTVKLVMMKAKEKAGLPAKALMNEFRESVHVLEEVISKVPVQFKECSEIDSAMQDLKTVYKAFMSFRKKKGA